MKRIWKGFGEWVAVEMDSRDHAYAHTVHEVTTLQHVVFFGSRLAFSVIIVMGST
jgi:hypothetical protein